MNVNKFSSFAQQSHAAGDGITGFLMYGTRECDDGQHFCIGYAYYGSGVQEHNVIARESVYFILEGELEVTCSGETVVVKKGDSISFAVGDEEWCENKSTKTAEVLVIMGRTD